MNNIKNRKRRSVSAKSNGLALLCVALALAGCGKPAAKSPEKSLVRTAIVQPMADVRSDGEASPTGGGSIWGVRIEVDPKEDRLITVE